MFCAKLKAKKSFLKLSIILVLPVFTGFVSVSYLKPQIILKLYKNKSIHKRGAFFKQQFKLDLFAKFP